MLPDKIKISYFKTIVNDFDVNNPAIVNLWDILSEIKNGKRVKQSVLDVRSQLSKDDRDRYKKRLPAAIFAGEFSCRRIDGFIRPSSIVNIDFDGMNKEYAEGLRNKLTSDKHVISVFESPSGLGIKALVHASFTDYDSYKNVFCAIDRYFGQDEHFDLSCSDISRGCYMSYDPNIYINKDPVLFEDKVDDYSHYMELRRLSTPEKTFDYLNRWLNKKGIEYVKNQRNDYIYKLSSAMCRYGVKEEKTVILTKNRFTDLDGREIEQSVKSAYKRNDFGVVKISIHDPDNDEDYYKKLVTPDATFDPASVIINPIETNDSILKIADGIIENESTGLTALDKYFPLKTRELYGFVAGSKTGKTLILSFLSEMAAKNSNWNFIVLTTETEVKDYKATMVSFLLDRHMRGADKDKIIQALDFIDSHFIFITNDVDHLQVLDVYHYTVSKGLYIHAIIIDPITNVAKSKRIEAKSGNDYYDELYVRYLKFSKQYCSLWVVAHTVTGKERERIVPYVQDAEYGVYLARRCHYGITFYRAAYDEMKSRILEFHIRYVRTSLMRGGEPTMAEHPIEFEFNANPYEFGYNVTIDGVKWKNPLLYNNERVSGNYLDFKYEKERDDEFLKEREANF